MYMIAFSKESWPLMIFMTIGFIHPAVMVPITYLMDTFDNLSNWFKNLFTQPLCSSTLWSAIKQRLSGLFMFEKQLRRLFNISPVLYLALIAFIQSHLYSAWLSHKENILMASETKKQNLCTGEFNSSYQQVMVKIKANNDFKNIPFDQCNQPMKAISGRENVNVLHYLQILNPETKLYIMRLGLVFLCLFHIFDATLRFGQATNQLVAFFYYKPKANFCQIQGENSTGSSPLFSWKQCNILFCNFLAILIIICILCLFFTFQYLICFFLNLDKELFDLAELKRLFQDSEKFVVVPGEDSLSNF